MKLDNLTIRKKLTLMLMLTSTAAVLLVGLTTFGISIFGYRRAMINDLESLAQVVGNNSIVALQFNIPEDAEQVLEALLGKPTIALACLYDAQGKVFALYRNDKILTDLSPPPVGPEGHLFSLKGIGIFKPIYLNEQLVGTIYLHDDLKILRSTTKQSVVFFALIMFFTLLATYVISSRLQRIISGPIQGLSSTAKEISAQGDYSLRARKESEDEVGALVDAFNEMLIKIQKRNTTLKMNEKELKNHRDHLEDMVKERTDQLAVAKEQAVAANASKSDFLARMSHEIRTPMNAVIGLTNIVLKSDLAAAQRDYLNKVQIASNNLLSVINDILDFSKVEAGQLDLEHHPFQLDQLMEQLAVLFGDRATQKDLKLRFSVASHVPRQLIGDASRLNQVLTNLIGNAVKFTDHGEIVVSVDLDDADSIDQDQAALKFSVSDTGVGISYHVLRTLFDPFTQADDSPTRKHEGTGLGLAICRQLVNLMGGRIWAESRLGKGSTFSFTAMLETGLEPPKAVVPDDTQEPSALPVPHMTGRRVLVVEDSELNQDVAVALLEEMRLTVETANNGKIAVEKVTGSKPGYYHAVLMDIQMPEMDGYEATRHIREWENQQSETTNLKPQTKIPIIALTANALKGEKEKCLAANMNDYLPKPLDEKDLQQVMVKWICYQQKDIDSSDRL